MYDIAKLVSLMSTDKRQWMQQMGSTAYQFTRITKHNVLFIKSTQDLSGQVRGTQYQYTKPGVFAGMSQAQIAAVKPKAKSSTQPLTQEPQEESSADVHESTEQQQAAAALVSRVSW